MVQAHHPILLLTMNIDSEKKVMWDILRTPPKKSIKQQLEESADRGEPTLELYKTFVDCASRLLNRPDFKHLSFKDEVIHESVLALIKLWPKLVGSITPLSGIHTIVSSIAYSCRQKEKIQAQIKEDLLEIT